MRSFFKNYDIWVNLTCLVNVLVFGQGVGLGSFRRHYNTFYLLVNPVDFNETVSLVLVFLTVHNHTYNNNNIYIHVPLCILSLHSFDGHWLGSTQVWIQPSKHLTTCSCISIWYFYRLSSIQCWSIWFILCFSCTWPERWTRS